MEQSKKDRKDKLDNLREIVYNNIDFDDFLEYKSEKKWEKVKREKKWKYIKEKFTNIWDRKAIGEMELEDYTDIERKYSFTYWLEIILLELWSIRWWSAMKFWVYKKAEWEEYWFNKKFLEWEETWNNKKDSKEAFKKIRENIIKVIECVEEWKIKK